MKPRSFRDHGGGRPRRGAVFSLAALAVFGGCGWLLPSVIALTELRDRPLQAAFSGIAGKVSSGAATWRWLGGLEYRDVRLTDARGRTVVAIPRIAVDRGLLGLVVDPRDLGTLRVVGGDALVEVRRGGSSLEDVLAPWLATLAEPSASRVAFDLEVIDGAVEVVDLERRDAWRIADLAFAGRIGPRPTSGWTLSGRVVHAGEPLRDGVTMPAAAAEVRHDRATIAAAATATLARDGGWTISSAVPGRERALAVAGTRVPLGISSVWATRFASATVADGLADVRLDIALPEPPEAAAAPPVWQLAGTVGLRQFALLDAVTLDELVVIDHAEAPLDLAGEAAAITIRRCEVTSPVFTASASGRVALPAGDAWQWADLLAAGDFTAAAVVDLAAASRATPGGLRVRDDVRVTAGQLELSATAHGDGAERVLEVRASARDLAAVQGERQLRWNDPFSAWLRGRRSEGPQPRLRVEEARIASSAVEVSAAGDAERLGIQWTVDLGRLAAEAAEVLDLSGMRLAGTSRGRLDLAASGEPGSSTAKLSASLAQFACRVADGPEWRDEEIVVEAEGRGSVATGPAIVDACHAVLRAGEDRLELTQTGPAIVPWAALPLTGWRGLVRSGVHPAAGDAVSADFALAGDVGRWQARLATLGNVEAFRGWRFGGTVAASAAVAIAEGGWKVTRAGLEIEKFTATGEGRKIAEPRVVATGAGVVDPATGRFDISSAEVLTATVSLRSGGLSLRLAADPTERLRGRVQWQADLARLEHWLVEAAIAEAWPAGGRAWGTLEVLDTPAGTNLLVEATGNQLALAQRKPSSRGSAEPVWSEPRARLLVEVTRPPATQPDRLTVNRLALDSATFAVAAAGSVEDCSTRRLVTLAGTATYDLEMVSRLLLPWTGGRLRLAGAGSRPVTVRAPLDALVAAVVGDDVPLATGPERRRAQTARRGEVPVPEDWLSSLARAPGDGGPPAGAGQATPVTLPATRPADSAGGWLRGITLETSAAWTAADIDGVTFEPGTVDLRLFEGQLTFGPFELAAAGGRFRGAPWLRLVPLPGELVVPPGRIVDRVGLVGRLGDEWLAWAVPLVGRSTRTQGVVSVDVSGARIPFGDPFGGEFSGQLVFENTEVNPGGPLGPLATLIAKLQTLVDPRFAFGDKVVLLRVRPEPVRLRLVDRRLWHDGLVLEMGQLVVRSAGSVGGDGTLAMAAEVSFRGDLAGTTPVVGQLLRTPLVIPLKGTVERPQFDAAAIDQVVGRIVENTAEAVIKDGIGRGLEQLFGSPPPAGAGGPSP